MPVPSHRPVRVFLAALNCLHETTDMGYHSWQQAKGTELGREVFSLPVPPLSASLPHRDCLRQQKSWGGEVDSR